MSSSNRAVRWLVRPLLPLETTGQERGGLAGPFPAGLGLSREA